MRFRFVLLVVCLVAIFRPAYAQTDQNALQLSTQVAFEGYFRPDDWLPLQITATNNGQAVTGKLIVRPETSGRALTNAYSTPLDLPNSANKTTFLYIQARSFTRELVVEFVTDEGVRLAQETITLTALLPRDKLYVVVTGDTASMLPLGDVKPAGQNAIGIRWNTTHIPDNAFALQAIDVLFINNIDEDTLTDGQRQAIKTWVYRGGHLVAMGGINWQGVNSAVGELLPLQPTGTTTLDSVSMLARYLQRDDALTGRTIVATGNATPDAQILAQQDETPLLLRRSVGDGTVDYLALDPTTEPLRSWAQLSQFWLYSVGAIPIANPWGRGFLDTDNLANAIAILPNEQLLPPVQALIGFILAYIIMIGPVNYLILTRIKRQEWAWVTIPLFIVLFSVLATVVGFNLRGNEVILSRLRVVQIWDNADEAVEQSVVGLLSPRRAVYSLLPNDNRLLHVLPSIGQNPNILQSSVEMVQTTAFSAQVFGAEGGIFSNFATERTIEKPAISGQLTLLTNADNSQTFQGSIRNDSDQTLTQAVIVSRDMIYYLPQAISPNDLVTVDAGQIVLANIEGMPIPSNMENNTNLLGAAFSLGRNVSAGADELMTANRLQQDPITLNDSPETRAYLRREAFLKSFVRDQYNSLTIGDDAYLLAWTNEIPRDWTVATADWRSVDDTLYIVKLAITVEKPPSEQTVTLTPDRFVWTMTERIISQEAVNPVSALNLSSTQGGIDDVILNPNEGFAVRFTPLPTAKLTSVDSFAIQFTRASGFSNQMELSLWNWETGAWEKQALTIQEYVVENPQAYVASDGSVLVQMVSTYPSGISRIRDLKLTMTGNY